MSRKLRDELRRLHRDEQYLGPHVPRSVANRAVILYPNTYHVGMSNLGLHVVWAQVNATPGWSAERAFLPLPDDLAEHRRTQTPLLTVESQSPAGEFDLLAFSLSYELDAPNILRLLDLAGVPIRADQRDDSHPWVAVGGACCSLNIEPLAEFVDFAVVGEAEPVLPTLLAILGERLERGQTLAELSRLPGVYVPRRGDVTLRVQRQAASGLDEYDTASQILTPHTEFANVRLVEVSRGCPRACRFCVVPWALRPFRVRSAERILQLSLGTERVGLLGAAASEHPELERIVHEMVRRGQQVTLSASRTEGLSEQTIRKLAEGGMRTLTLAPETASDSVRRMLGKLSTRQDTLRVAQQAAASGFRGLRLYFMVGVPGAGPDEAADIADFAHDVASAAPDARLTLSVGPLIPKPFTPFQWAAMPPLAELEARLRDLQRRLARGPRPIKVKIASARWARIEALLSRGDRGLADCLAEVAQSTGSYADWLGALKRHRLPLDWYVHRQRERDEPFPWEVLDVGVARDTLWRLARGVPQKDAGY